MPTELEGGVLWPVARALIALIGVCLLAWVSLLWLSRNGLGSGIWARFSASRTGTMSRLRLIERLALGPRQRVYLVQADARVFLVGSGESGALSLIAELTNTSQPNAGP
jgi:flagellar biogenesis protein FliO